MTILITGFGPFDGGSNASERLVCAIDGQRPALSEAAGLPIVPLLLPVDTEEAPRLLADAMAEHDPSHVLLTGQAAGRNRITIETLAINRRHFSVPDAAGRILFDLPVREGGPPALFSTWPDMAGLAGRLCAAGVPATISHHAGAHLCNQLLYEVLLTDREASRERAVTFLHLPLLPEQIIAREPAAERHANCPFMPLAMTLQAVQIALEDAAGYRPE